MTKLYAPPPSVSTLLAHLATSFPRSFSSSIAPTSSRRISPTSRQARDQRWRWTFCPATKISCVQTMPRATCFDKHVEQEGGGGGG